MHHLYLSASVLALFVFCAGDLKSDPVILNSSFSANAGDVIYLQGSGFGSAPTVQYSFNDSNWKTLSPATATQDTLVVKIPANERNLPNLLAVRISPDGANWSQPVFLNRAHAMSFDASCLAAGAGFRVFGRNLFLGRVPTIRFVDQWTGAQAYGSVDTSLSSDYLLQATAPGSLQEGHPYSVYVSNSYNGNGSSGSETLADQPVTGGKAGADYWNLGVPWASHLDFYNNVYNISNDPRLSLHSGGWGSDTDSWVINEAIQTAAEAGGGIVYLPAGSYKLSFGNGCGLTLKPKVALVGDGPGLTTIGYGFGPAPSPDQGGYAICFAPTKSGISDLSLNNINQSGYWPQSALGSTGSEFFVQRVHWNVGTSLSLALANSSEFAIENSTITQGVTTISGYQGILNLGNSSHFVIRGNTLNFASNGMNFDRATNAVFENNEVIRNTSSPQPRDALTHVISASFASNFEILNNTFSVQGWALQTGNDGETINEESGGAVRSDEFRGTVTSFDSYSVTDTDQNFYSSGNYLPALQPGAAVVAIVNGSGAGQWRNVTGISADGHTLTIDQPWTVPPASGSNYATFDWGASNWIIASNKMSGNEKGIEFFNTSVLDILVVSNTLTNNSGIMFSPEQEAPGLSNLVAHVQVLNNNITDNQGLRPAYVAIVPREDGQASSFGVSVLGAEVRGNTVIANSPNTIYSDSSLDDYKANVEGFNYYWQWQSGATTFQDLGAAALGGIFQANTSVNAAAAFQLNTAVSQTFIQDTVLRNDGTLLNSSGAVSNDQVLPGALHASIATSVSGSWNYLGVAGYQDPQNSVQTATSIANGSAFLISPNQAYISGSDTFGLLGQQASSDLSAMARIALPAGADSQVSGLVIMRDTLTSNSAFAAVGPVFGGQVGFWWRSGTGGGLKTLTVPASSTANWVKLTKSGTTFNAYQSADGIYWAPIGQSTAVFSNGQYNVGLTALSSGAQGVQVRFDKVDIEPN